MASEEQPQGKVNPFKELPRPKQPQLEKKPQNAQKPGKEITITLRPWKLVKGLFVVMLLLGVFFAGRLTAGDDSFSLSDFSTYFSQDAGPSGLVTGDTKEAEAVKEEASSEAKTEETQLAESNETAAKVVEEVKPAEPADDTPEKVVSEEYTKVTLSLDGVYKDWKGTWGKIKGVKYTITNNEAGTIKPHHFSMVVEGYEDGEKHFDVGIASQRVKAGQTVSDEAAVSGGFAYSPVSIPDSDLSKVRISLVLVDADGDTMATVAQDVNLNE